MMGREIMAYYLPTGLLSFILPVDSPITNHIRVVLVTSNALHHYNFSDLK